MNPVRPDQPAKDTRSAVLVEVGKMALGLLATLAGFFAAHTFHQATQSIDKLTLAVERQQERLAQHDVELAVLREWMNEQKHLRGVRE